MAYYSHAEMSASFARISIHKPEYSLTLSRPCRRSLQRLSTLAVFQVNRHARLISVISARRHPSPRRVCLVPRTCNCCKRGGGDFTVLRSCNSIVPDSPEYSPIAFAALTHHHDQAN